MTNSIKEMTAQACSQEIDLIDSCLSLLEEGFEHANFYPNETHDQVLARKGLVSQNFNTLRACYLLATEGFYLQSLGLGKNLYENWLAFWYLAKFPQEANRWLKTDEKSRPPNAETMRNKINHTNPKTKNKLKDFYSEMNRFAHTDPVAVIDRYKSGSSGLGIFVGVEFDKGDFFAAVYFLALWTGNMLDAVSVWIPVEHKWHEIHKTAQEKILKFLDEYNNSRAESTP